MEEGSLASPETVSFDLAPRLGEIVRMFGIVEAFGEKHGIPASTLYQVTLVLDELITNIVSYGIEPGDSRPIRLALSHRDQLLTVSLSDHGRRFDPASVAPPDTGAALEDREIGGLGLHFARTLMDSFDWRYEGGCNHVTFTKRTAEVQP